MRDKDAAAQIAELRDEIDDLDKQIVGLLNERKRIALEIRDLKPQVNQSLYDPKREEEIFSNLAAVNDGPLYDDNLRDIYEAVLHAMKEL